MTIGTVVRLRSGSPPMTITELRADGHAALCTWFANDALHGFELPTLALVEQQITNTGWRSKNSSASTTPIINVLNH